jgi:hypothetical protein
MASFNNQAVAP